MSYRDPKPGETETPLFNAIWEVIKGWDINVPEEYGGYMGAIGNHVCAIIDAIQPENEQRREGREMTPIRERFLNTIADVLKELRPGDDERRICALNTAKAPRSRRRHSLHSCSIHPSMAA